MKKIVFIIFLVLTGYVGHTCPVCEKQQPKILRGITHGTGPDSQWDYFIVSITVIIVLFTLFYSLKWIIHPGEKAENHIKNLVIDAD